MAARRSAAGIVLVLALALQAGFSSMLPRDWSAQRSLGTPPDLSLLRLLTLGETRGAAYGLALQAQSHDAQAGRSLSLRSLDLNSTYLWLEAAQTLAPEQAYPLFLAARIFAELSPPPVARRMLELVHAHFGAAPDERWPWMAHAVYVARHVLKDDALAAAYARSVRERATGPGVPQWARDMEIFILAASNQLEAAQRLLGALLDSDQITDARELEVMTARLAEMKSRLPSAAVAPDSPSLVGDERSAVASTNGSNRR